LREFINGEKMIFHYNQIL